MHLSPYIQYLIGGLRGIRPACKTAPGNYKQTRSTVLGPMPFIPGPMPLVTRDPQVRYPYGVGRVLLVTNYIRILLSHMCMAWAECHSSHLTGRCLAPGAPTPPFGVLGLRGGVLAPEHNLKILWTFIKFSVYYLCNIDRISELGTIRGDRTMCAGKKYNEVLSPRIYGGVL